MEITIVGSRLDYVTGKQENVRGTQILLVSGAEVLHQEAGTTFRMQGDA